ncbi:PREDICTED: maltase 1-like [Dufourea novaeangliae]|uniref:alpha-glucosidase n=1 Tax=Dufourea novaeangliae TaxID=178035 RepID=A0A154PFJ5_DUFNO|nr:PREDICTED: maltase 1-like [Dufourea novaeangliae]KZC10587.1 Maltase 1 [Dufourea novaeangliae]
MKSTGCIVILLFATLVLASAEVRNKGWWKNMVFYQIYPRSFMDSDGDGIGDLKGITSKLQHFKDSGVGAIWLSPINKSPMVDNGYDISDFKDIDKTFGKLSDFDDLIKKAKELGLKVILDLVPNHTSDDHYWFQMSVKREGKYADYYIWSDGKNNKKSPPNNWASVFNNSGWTLHQTRNQYYFHQFYPQQPDLNYNNPEVQLEMKAIMRYWLDKGLDGFRIDAVPHLFETNLDKDEPPSNIPGAKPGEHLYLNHIYTKDQPETYKLIQSWREFVDKYAEENKRDEIVLMTEAYTSWNNTIAYYNYGSNVPFNFKFITDANSTSTAQNFKNITDSWLRLMPKGSTANWVMGNHDRNRVATRYPGRPDQMTMLAMILPGVVVTYYGEEIGMVDGTTIISDFRDGCRTPFQWNDSTSAGFSSSSKPWLPVNPDYKTLNLDKQTTDNVSHYNLYKKLIKLRNSLVALKNGDVQTHVLNNEVFIVTRNTEDESVALLINFSSNSTVIDLTQVLKGKKAEVKLSDVKSNLTLNTAVTMNAFNVPAKGSVVLIAQPSGASSIAGISLTSVLLMAFVPLFRP